MSRIAVKWGVLLTAALVVWTLVVHALGIYTVRLQYADGVDRVVLVIPGIVLTLAMLDQRRAQGGRLGLRRGLAVGTLVAAISAPLTTSFMIFYHSVINPEWLQRLIAYKSQALPAAGVASDEVDRLIAQLQQSGTVGHQVTGGLLGTFVMGVILSLVLATVITAGDARRRRMAVPVQR